jgi:hypothetical protein
MSERFSSARSDWERDVSRSAARENVSGHRASNPETAWAGLENSANPRYWRMGRAGGRSGYIRLCGRCPRSLHVGVEPGQGALDYVAAMLGAGEQVTFMLVDYELRFNA